MPVYFNKTLTLYLLGPQLTLEVFFIFYFTKYNFYVKRKVTSHVPRASARNFSSPVLTIRNWLCQLSPSIDHLFALNRVKCKVRAMQIFEIMGSVNFTKKIKANFRSISMESSEYNDNNISPPNYFDRGIFCKGGFFHPLLSGYTKQPHNFLCDVIRAPFKPHLHGRKCLARLGWKWYAYQKNSTNYSFTRSFFYRAKRCEIMIWYG